METTDRHKTPVLERICKGEVKQETLDEWISGLEKQITRRQEAIVKYEKLREAIKKAHDAGMSLREISKFVGVTHGTVFNWLGNLRRDPVPRISYGRMLNAQKTKDVPPQ
jgi:IS30 family transposase